MIQELCYFMVFVIALFFMFVIDVICDLPKHFPKRNRFMTCAHYYIYRVFMDVVKERKLQPYTLVMGYKQIISMLNVQELNLKNTIIDPSCFIFSTERLDCKVVGGFYIV